MSELKPAVISEVMKRFSPSDVAKALTMLRATPVALLEADAAALDRARVHMAAIKRASGDLEQLRAALELATQDWRDLLIEAGLARDDWQAVLAREGFLVP